MIAEKQVQKLLRHLPENSFLKRYVDYASICTDANAAYHVAVALPILAQSAPKDLSITFGVPMYTNIYVLLVGKSTTARKTASVRIGRQVLRDAIPASEGEIPGSWEALMDCLKQQPRQLICYTEFGSFLNTTEKGYLNPLKTKLTEAFDGAPIGRSLVRRKGQGGSGEVRDPRLSLLAGCAPGYLEQHTSPVDWTEGFMARFYTIFADRERSMSMPEENAEVRAALSLLLHSYAEPQQPGPCVGLDPAARRLWDAFNDETAAADPSTEAAGAVARAPSFALKIAMLLAWDFGTARSGQPWQITPFELEPAMEVTRWHIQSVLAIGELLAVSRDMRDRKAVLGCLTDRGITSGEIAKKAKLLKKRVLEILDTLLDEDTIEKDVSAKLDNKERYRVKTIATDRPNAKVISIQRTTYTPPTSSEVFRVDDPTDSTDAAASDDDPYNVS